jgi:sugar phosphate isomerase/epimerase
MIKIAFSTVACPDWTLQKVADRLDAFEFDGVELRTFGDGSTRFACDPALTDPAKVRRLFSADGAEIAGLGSSARFDEPRFPPPPLGFALGDDERSVREAKPIVELAQRLNAPVVRVFGFEGRSTESHKSLRDRVVRRLRKLVDHARNTNVKIALETGGAFSRTAQVLEVLDAIDNPMLGVSYSLAAARQVGENPAEALKAIGPRLLQARVKDLQDGEPVPLGQGELGAESFVRAVASTKFAGWLIYEWDAAWLPWIAPADDILPGAARTLGGWLAQTTSGAPATASV